MKNPRVSIVILNWNGWEDTIECLQSLYELVYPNYDVVLVDNGSTDGSIDKIKAYCRGELTPKSKYFDAKGHKMHVSVEEYTEGHARSTDVEKNMDGHYKLTIIRNGKNLGFAEGNNVGIRYALTAFNPEYVLLLNNDTVVDSEFLNELIGTAEKDISIGFAGPKVYYYDYEGRSDIINFAGGRIDFHKWKAFHIGFNEEDMEQHDRISDVDYVEGSCLLARRDLIDRIGMLNPNFFAYWEEVDWCIRCKEAGYRCVYVPSSRIWHKGSKSTKKLSGFKEYHLIRNRLWLMKKSHNMTGKIYFLVYFFLFEFWLTLFIFLVKYKKVDIVSYYLKGILDGFSQNSNGKSN